jgi:hypothetical protein
VSFVETEAEMFLKTIIPSRKAPILWPTERTCMDLAGLNLLMDSATN